MNKSNQVIGWKKTILLITGIFAYALIKGFYFNSPGEQNNSHFKSLFNQQSQGEMVHVVGHVYKVLPDDTKGDKHQRLLIAIDGVSVLIAHNIDLAPRVPVKENDELVVFGEYIWNEKGGVIHWTHHDPQNRHESGWIEHKGKKYK